MTAVATLILVVVLAIAVGMIWRYRSGRVRATGSVGARSAPQRTDLLAAAGVTTGRPTVLHFSADWCAPCGAVRTVVDQVVGELADEPRPPADIELDIDRNPLLAKELGVLSLPTTFIFDADRTERFRISGVPALPDLRSALSPLSKSG